MTMVWTNSDGLQVMFGTEQGRVNRAGAVQADSGRNMIKVLIDYTQISTTTGTKVALVDNVILPSGALVTSASLTVLTAFTGSSSTLDIGFQKLDGTELDYDGIDAAIALTAINAVGKQVTCDGALINGVATTASGVPYIKAGTAGFTAGKAEVRILYKQGTAV